MKADDPAFRRRAVPAGGPRCAGPVSVLLACVVLALATPSPAVELPGSLRDAFPVFNDPAVVSADAAEAEGIVGARDFVIGLALGGSARAYPIAVMGIHELGNDTVGGVPVAVTW